MIKGKLFIISTPIGNLGDMSYRAVETLKSVPLVLSEDTRETLKILRKYNIGEKTQLSYRDQNHNRVIEGIIKTLDDGADIALVSDSGTPLISDPGYKLVRELIDYGIDIISIPGPSSLTSGLVVSGLPTDRIVFLGFLPKIKSHRVKLIKMYGELENTVVIFESPFRVRALLNEIMLILGNRKICLVKDLTKIYENIWRGTVSQIINETSDINFKGEYIVLIGKDGI